MSGSPNSFSHLLRRRRGACRAKLIVTCLVATVIFPILAGPEGLRLRAEESPGGAGEAAQNTSFPAEQLEFFERQVRPLLVEHCYACHSGENEEKTRGGLRLDSRAAVLVGGDTGPSAIAGDPRQSVLIDAVEYGDLYQMPPKSKLQEGEIQILTKWVEMGLPWTPEATATSSAAASSTFDVEARRREHWAWQPLTRPALPDVKDESWERDPIDRFVLEKLEERGMSPSPVAPPHMLIRRVFLDLIGLPPSPEDVKAYVEDPSPEHFASLVDRLLESPQFGERWARHWLDLVRYAESRGHEFDFELPNAYQYRDYVIRALNADVPYDQWMVEHVAGDLLETPRRHPGEGFNESILGTGFWFLGEWVHSPVDIRMDECDRFDNMLDVFSKTFLGLTVACARCHDHKFDAIPQSDYYALFGFLQSSGYRQAPFDTLDHHREIAEQLETLSQNYRQRLVEAVEAPRRQVTDRLADYLLAAQEGLLKSPTLIEPAPTEDEQADQPVGKLSDESRQALTAVAERRGLDPELVLRWGLHLLEARHDSADPFALWSQFALQRAEGGIDVAGAIQKWRHQQVVGSEPPSDLTGTNSTGHFSAEQIVLDYRHFTPNSGSTESSSSHSQTGATIWLNDGYAFGSGPARAGDLEISNEAPLRLDYRREGAARREPFWRSLKLAEQTAPESGKLGTWPRAGQTIRTPSFHIQSGPVHYLVRGSGVAYAAVNSHVMFAGPLHGNLIQEFKHSDPTELRWVTHDLTRYQNHRVHIEFHPLENEPLEIIQVVQSPEVPPVPKPRAAIALLDWLDELEADADWALVASRYQQAFQQLTDLARQGKLGDAARNGRSSPSDFGAFAGWWLNQGALFGASEDEDRLEELHAEYLQERETLGKDVRRRSRTAPAMFEGTGMDERLMIRGNPRTLGDRIPRQFLTAIAGREQPAIDAGSGRDQLADWLVDPANPFPSRVMVNRLWHHLTGRGIVASTDNFGVLGEPPTHPELLDHLATSFIDEGWSIKQMIRRIVLSSTYQMSSTPRPDVEPLDPEVIWLHRMRIRRLQGEAIRDTLLALSGRLDTTLYGPSVPVYLTPFMQGRGRPAKSGPLDGDGRRSLYIAVRRNFLSPMMLAFDTPQPFSSVGRRNSSNVPAQALILMNDPLVTELARQWAHRVLADQPDSMEEGVHRMYSEAFSRPPSAAEWEAAKEFLISENSAEGTSPLGSERAWAEYAHVLMNVKELILVE